MSKNQLQRLVVASGNAGKLRELERLLEPLGIVIQSQVELGVPAAEEPYDTFLENALTKARHASAHTGTPALADDSGICVPALGGAPGVRSARYADPVEGAKQDELNNQKLIAALANTTERQACYVAVLALVMHPQDPLPIIAQGLWFGQVIDQPLGSHGFGYDPHFWLPELNATAAQLSAAQKNQVSHRGQAMQSLIEQIKVRGLVLPATRSAQDS
jgi:XTP/dITP diphosphohydrolase